MAGRGGEAEFGVLGPLEVSVGGRAVTVGRAQLRTLLAALVVQRGAVVAADRLVEVLWGDQLPPGAGGGLTKVVYRLRKVLAAGPAGSDRQFIVTRAPGYVLDVPAEWVDAGRFEVLLGQAQATRRAGDHPGALRLFDEALGLWRGPALVEFSFEEFARGEAARLDELRLVATEEWVDVRLALGDHERLVGDLEGLVGGHPFRERLWAQLMLALYRAERQSEALRAFGRLKRLLGEELGIEPSVSLRGLEEAVLLQKPELDWAPFEPSIQSAEVDVTSDTTALSQTAALLFADADGSPRPGDEDPDGEKAVSAGGPMTFLFTDIEGSTGLWEGHPSLMAASLDRHDHMVTDVVRAEGGEVFKTVGDAVHAVFASPVAAVRAAVGVQAAVADAEWGDIGALAVRIGVYTGEAVFAQGDWQGRPLKRCARLRDAAAGHQILASHATVELIGDDLAERAVITDLGEWQLRGVGRPERVHLVQPLTAPAAMREAPQVGPPAADPVGSLPPPLVRIARRTLIGRQAELDRVARCLSSADGSTHVVLVAGEPGAGKTRLAAAAARAAAADGALLLYGRCDEGLRVPYQPFVEALGSYVTAAPKTTLGVQLGSTGRELSRLLPGLGDRIAGLRAPTIAEPETERWLLFEAAAHFVRAIAADRLVMLVVDDLHWAEPATLLLLRHLARAGIEGLFIVATARPAAHSEPDAFAEALADLAREHLLETVTLGGLSGEEVTELVADRLHRPADAAFARAVHAETGGNPFFVHELVSHLSDLGVLAAGEGAWPTAAQVERSGAPQGVRHVLSRRIGQLSPSGRATLVVAAVAGGEFQAADLAMAMGDDLASVTMALEEATASGLVAESGRGPGGYRFAHALVRHTLYESASGLHRAQLHWRVAEAVRASAGPPASRLSELAYHYRYSLEAGDPATATHWLQQAGDQAVRQVAFEDAIEHYRAALTGLDLCPDEPDRRYHLLAGLAESAAALSDFEVSQPAWLAAAQIAQTAKDPARFFRAVVGYGYIIMIGADEALDRLIVDGLELAGPADSVERAQLLAWSGAKLFSTGSVVRRREEREGTVRDALAMGRRLNDLSAQSWALGSLGAVLLGSSQAAEQLATHQEELQLMEALGLDQERVLPYRNLALASIQLGRRIDAGAALERAETIARAGNRRLELHNVLMVGAAIAIAEGRFDEAKSLVAEVRDIGDARNPSIVYGYSAQISAIRAEQGRAERVVDALPNIAETPSARTAAWVAMRTALCADIGWLDDAAEQLDALAADRFAVIPRDSAFPLAIRYLAETCAQLADGKRAAEMLPEVQPYSGQLLVVALGTSIEGAADRSLGQLYGLLGRVDDADRHFEAARRLEDSMGFAPLAARTRYWHARLLAQSGNTDDRRRARSLLTATQSTTTALGMPLLHQQASQLHELLEQHKGTSPPGGAFSPHA
jgi:DNA-binding SARP family transcriptional activator/class 3 adenylate cyclase/tetratricopeptide (TPR) repeat protein